MSKITPCFADPSFTVKCTPAKQKDCKQSWFSCPFGKTNYLFARFHELYHLLKDCENFNCKHYNPDDQFVFNCKNLECALICARQYEKDILIAELTSKYNKLVSAALINCSKWPCGNLDKCNTFSWNVKNCPLMPFRVEFLDLIKTKEEQEVEKDPRV